MTWSSATVLNVERLNLFTEEREILHRLPGDPDKVVINDAGIFEPSLPNSASYIFVGTKTCSKEGERLATVTQICSNGETNVIKEGMYCSNMNFIHTQGFTFLLFADTERGIVERQRVVTKTPSSIALHEPATTIISCNDTPGAHPDGGHSLGDGSFCYAVFNTNPSAFYGRAYLADWEGRTLAQFETDRSPRVTNILPVVLEGDVRFIITTARETTDASWLKERSKAGYIFISEPTGLSPDVVIQEPRFTC